MAAVNLIGSYNYALVALSVLIAMFASYAALDLAGRVTAAGGWTRAVWLLGGAGAMGTGIWSMHYIGMLASRPSFNRATVCSIAKRIHCSMNWQKRRSTAHAKSAWSSWERCRCSSSTISGCASCP